MVVLGVNLRASIERPSAVVGLDCRSQVVLFNSFKEDSELLEIARKYKPRMIAVGSPLSLPAGLCCLESECACDFALPEAKGRQFELDLSRMGISCFFTTKTSITRELIYRGVDINRQLSGSGNKVIEVYPYATKIILFGDGTARKAEARNPQALDDQVAGLVTGLNHVIKKMDRNTRNAVLNAYTALLHSRDNTDVLGTPEEGLLVLPRLPSGHPQMTS